MVEKRGGGLINEPGKSFSLGRKGSEESIRRSFFFGQYGEKSLNITCKAAVCLDMMFILFSIILKLDLRIGP